jgi:ribokinase
VHRAGVLLLQLETPLETVQAAAAATRGTVVLNPAPAQPLPAELLARVDVLVPNEHELAQLAGTADPGSDPAALADLARGLTTRSVVVTLGEHGALIVPAEGPALLQAPPPVDPVDTTGAGDCFCGALSSALDRGEPLPDAVRYAVTAAALSTTGPGARGALPDDDAVQALLPRTPPATAVDR